MIFDQIKRFGNHEQVLFFQEPKVNLKGIIAIHSTRLGPGLGGCRIWPYKSESAALEDVLKLSRGMTYKAAVAGLGLGGGKTVIIGDSKQKTPELFQAYGRVVQSLNGKYITAEDVGTSVEDMRHIRTQTSFVAGLSREFGGCGVPSPFTARSVLVGMQAAVQHKMNRSSLEGLRVAIQGMGHVGWYLAELLLQKKCQVIICDMFEDKACNFQQKHPEVELVSSDAIYDVECDIFSPCALGGVVSSRVVNRLKCGIIAGAANNQLDTLDTEAELKKRGILYAPDFVINAGGLISVFEATMKTYSEKTVLQKINNIYDVLIDIFTISQRENKTPTDVAIEIAHQRIYNGNYSNGIIRNKKLG